MKDLFLAISLTFSLTSGAQPSGTNGSLQHYRPSETTIYYQLGDRRLPIKIYHYGAETGIVMINLHDNETTSVRAARVWLEQNGGTMIRFENNNQRTMRFQSRGLRYEFDPNRIFSREGITASLREQGLVTEPAIAEVEHFAERILQLIPEKTNCIIALHNNTEGLFSVTSYLPGHERERDAKMVTTQPDQDADDIFLTTDSMLYSQLADKGYNSILQDIETVKRDGSLSVYCGEKGWRYLNCETQHGRTEQYLAMIKVAGTYLQGGIPGGLVYEFRIGADASKPGKGQDIWFGDKRVGVILTGPSTRGRLAMEPGFPLFSNMDFFYYRSSGTHGRLELRIDPTRDRRPLDRSAVSLEIVTR